MDYRQLNKRKPLGADAIQRIATEAGEGYAQYGEDSPYAKKAQEEGGSSLYQALQEAGIETDNHESDLYVKDSPEARAIIEEFGDSYEPFNADDGSGRWLDVPFAYAPFWESKGMRASRRSAQGAPTKLAQMEGWDQGSYDQWGLDDELKQAVDSGDAAQVASLLSQGADPTVDDAEAMRLAIDSGNPEVLSALEEAGYSSSDYAQAYGLVASRRSAQEYQGWSNYSTWAVALWISNDQGLYDMVQEAAAESEDAYALGQYIESMFDEMAPELDGVYADLMRGAVSEVNWQEVAQDFLEAW
jgi:hypothetical protein